MSSQEIHPASYRDPSGFVYRRDGQLYRQINPSYADTYRRISASGLYEELISDGLLIPHREVDRDFAYTPDAAVVLEPEPLPFISHPQEWCFSALREAAILTLEIQERALAKNFVLKDASAYNIQFVGTRPIFIDTLSFEPYRDGRPWAAYEQFCRHFLVPLCLMRYRDLRLGRLFRAFPDGIPVELASRLLPARTWLHPIWAIHIHSRRFLSDNRGQKQVDSGGATVSRSGLAGIVDSLASGIQGLDAPSVSSEWSDYYAEQPSYSSKGIRSKELIVQRWLRRDSLSTVWDLGANTGRFSQLAAVAAPVVVALDADEGAVELAYRRFKDEQEEAVLPLVADIADPTPGFGWNGVERASLLDRGPADLGLALALVHHLVLRRNLPLERIADTLARTARRLVFEWIPPDDPKVGELAGNRTALLERYSRRRFDAAMRDRFDVLEEAQIADSRRSLLLMERID